MTNTFCLFWNSFTQYRHCICNRWRFAWTELERCSGRSQWWINH